MMIKKAICVAAAVVMAVLCLTGCGASSVDSEAIHQQLIGAWVLVNDPEVEKDPDGNIVRFGVYEFLETETRYHDVQMAMTNTYPINEYSIMDGKYRVMTEEGVQFSGIRFTETGNLVLYTDTTADEFRPLTDEEIKEFAIPVNKADMFESETGSEGSETEAAAE